MFWHLTDPSTQYPFANYSSPWFVGSAILGDAWFSCATRDTARWLTAAGAPVFVYFYTHMPTITPLTGTGMLMCATASSG